MMGEGSYFNRAARRSGGSRPFKVSASVLHEGVNNKPLSTQCFEQRHSECDGHDCLFNEKCECSCHNEAKP